MSHRLPGGHRLVAPAALAAFVASLGLLPYVAFARDQGSVEAFKSAFDEDTYLLGDTPTPYRFVSGAFVDVLDFLTPGVAGLLIAADVVIPALVALAAWLLVTRLVGHTGLRILSVLLLLFGQELFSLANSIVWPDREIVDLQELDPPTTLTLIPDATTSYFSLFRTPEPAVSWVLLFGFLALISHRDPLAAFESRRRFLTYPLFAVLGFAYPFSSIPIMLITAVLLGWVVLNDRSRIANVGGAFLLGTASFLLAMLISVIGDPVSGTSVVFSSRSPILTPALVIGALLCVCFVLIHRSDVLRRLDVLIPFTAALVPVGIANQQLVTGVMVSARDWERYTNYPLIIFAAICLIADLERRRPDWERADAVMGVVAWILVVYLGVQLVGWQRDVYDVWAPTNVEAHETADLLDGLPGAIAQYPVVLDNAGLVPFVRILTDDEHTYVLDYTRLFGDPVPSFADGTPTDQPGPHRDQLFAYAYRLGWSPAQLADRVRSELEGEAGGFYSHFLFAHRDVWPPATDSRGLRTEEALDRLPRIRAAYSYYLDRQTDEASGRVLVVTDDRPADRDGRTNELVAAAARSSGTTPPLSVYVQTADR